MNVAETETVPRIPDHAPFTVEQRAWLNGFLAGLFSRNPSPDGPTPERHPEPTLIPLAILFGSQTGTAEGFARRIAKEAGKRGFAPTLHDMGKYPIAQLASEQRALIVTSTFGDGEPPDNARSFWEQLNSEPAPKLNAIRYTVCALGDSNYPKFCGFGKDLDARLDRLGAHRAHTRVDCDVECEAAFESWLDSALSSLRPNADERESLPDSEEPRETIKESERMGSPMLPSETISLSSPLVTASSSRAQEPPAPFSRSNPFRAALVVNRSLNKPGSFKDTRHVEFDLAGSNFAYEPGDALGVLPTNCPELVDELLAILNFSGGEAVPARDAALPVREALLHHYEITRIPPPLLRVMAERTGDELLGLFSSPGAGSQQFLRGREIIDLLLQHRNVRFAPIEFVGLLRKLNPRLYSISSSPKACVDRVHVTVSVVRYESLSRRRKGVCSTYLAERVPASGAVPVFIHTNRGFRLPRDLDTPIIMVGPGTGIAPFRGFLQERAAMGARGRHWLFYGDQRSGTDFMYRDELEKFIASGTLTRLDTAFSRDHAHKVYVQDRMRENARELFAWLEQGAHFYVCGDATRMAKDVDAALRDVLQTAGAFSPDRAAEYVAKMKSEKRYQRDVY